MTHLTPWTTALATACCLAALPAAQAAGAADTTRQGQIESRYRSERQVCLDGRSQQDRSTCLREAGAARQQARAQQLDNGESVDQLRRNALARCQAQQAADQGDCQRLVRGEGQRSGSVAGGGVLMQITTRTTAAGDAGSPAPSAADRPAAAASR